MDLDFVTRQLTNEGVQKFIEPYDLLMKTLAARREQVLADLAGRQVINPGAAKAEFAAALDSLDAKQFGRRLYAHDALLWKSDAKMCKQFATGWVG